MAGGENFHRRILRKARVLVDFTFSKPAGAVVASTSVPAAVCLATPSLSFFRHGKSIAPMWLCSRRRPNPVASNPHRHNEFQPLIPWRVALQQCPPPLHRLTILCSYTLDKAVIVIDGMTEANSQQREQNSRFKLHKRLTPSATARCSPRQLGENASYRHGRGRTFGISRLRPQSLRSFVLRSK